MSTIQDIKLLDIEKRRTPSKHYAYIIEVSWSDGYVVNIGRAYSDFFNFQMNLLDKFPSEAGQHDPTRRIIPFLPGKSLFQRSNTREYATKRMVSISEYCTGISKMPRYLVENAIVEDFFRPTPKDEASRARSSSQENTTPTKNASKANEITGPLVLDKYVAIADYSKENKKELSLESGQVLEVVEKSENGWWLAANEEGMNGWVPATYLEPLYGEATSPTVNERVKPGEGEMYEADSDFTASGADEMTFKIGDTLEVLEKSLEGWWYAKLGSSEGWVPATYLQKSSLPTPKPDQSQHDQISKKSYDAEIQNPRNLFRNRLKERGSIEGNKKPPPKRSTVRRTLTKAAVARVQVDFRKKFLEAQANAITDENDDEDVELNETYLTVDQFDATIPDGLSFSKNETVHVIRKSNAGWWYGRIGNKRGWIPESYLTMKSKPLTLLNSAPSPKPPVSTKPARPAVSPKPARPPAPKTKLPKPTMFPILPVLQPGKKQLALPEKSPKPTEIDLADYEWYRDVSRQQAEEALLCEGQEGYFIIRPSIRGEKKGKPYSLTLYSKKTNWNFHIRFRDDKKYAVGIYKESEACFGTLAELVDHYMHTPLVLGDEERKVWLVGSPQELYSAC